MTTFEIISAVGTVFGISVAAGAWFSSRSVGRRANDASERLARIEHARFGREEGEERIKAAADSLFRMVKQRADDADTHTNLVGVGIDLDGPDDRSAARLLEQFPGVAAVSFKGDCCVVWVKRSPDLGDMFGRKSRQDPSLLG